MNRISIIIADDHDLVRSSLRASLNRYEDLKVIAEASNGDEALELVSDLKPDILICDIRMPNGDGLKVAHSIKTASPTTRLLVLSAYDNEEYVGEMVKAGVAGYLLKTAELTRVVESIRLIHNGQVVFNPEINVRLGGLLPKSYHTEWQRLTPREFKIISFVSGGKTSQTIANDLGLSCRTVDTYVTNMLWKLGFKSRAAASAQFLKDKPEYYDHSEGCGRRADR